MRAITEQNILEATDLIINTRDFCGDEMAAICDYCADENIADWKALWRIANFRANAKWNSYKKAAGVNPKYCL